MQLKKYKTEAELARYARGGVELYRKFMETAPAKLREALVADLRRADPEATGEEADRAEETSGS